jgi:magnesium transporter
VQRIPCFNTQVNEQLPDSAGRLATASVPRTTKVCTVADVLADVQSFSNEYETIDYVYVLEGEILVGVASLHELLAAKPAQKIASIMTEIVACVHQNTDQENVAHLALAQNIKAVPVVDTQNAFIGVVTADNILRILRDEHTEDVLKYAGINFTASERLSQFTTWQHLTSRLPWLVIGLGGGILAAWVVEKYSYAIESELALAAFIPAIVYIADSVGSQTQMVYVRSLTSQFRTTFIRSLGKELLIGTLVGIMLSLLIASISWLWLENLSITLILATSVIVTVYFSVVTAITLPWVFDKAGKDPALATGPLATVIRDVSSLAIYFFIALHVL